MANSAHIGSILELRRNEFYCKQGLPERPGPVQGAEGLRRSCGIDEKVFQPLGEESRAPCLGDPTSSMYDIRHLRLRPVRADA